MVSRTSLLLLSFLVFFIGRVTAREYSQQHSFRPPFVAGVPINNWVHHGGAELSNKYIKFNVRAERQSYVVNTQAMQSPGWESRIQTWTGGPGEAGYSLYMSNSPDVEKISDGSWEGAVIKISLTKGSQNEDDTIAAEVVQKKGKNFNKLGECKKSYLHNPNLFVYLKFVNGGFELRYAYESVSQYFDCLVAPLIMKPGYFFILATPLPTGHPVDRQDLYAIYTYPLEGIIPEEEPSEITKPTKPQKYVPPAPSNFLATLNTLLQRNPDRNVPQADLIPLYNEFFHDIQVIDEQHEHLKALASSIKEIILQLQFEQEEEHDFFEHTLSEVIDEAATGDDLRVLLQDFVEAERKNLTDDLPSARLAREVSSLKEVVTSSSSKIHKDLDEFGSKVKGLKNSLDISHEEHRQQIQQIESLTRDLSKTVESNSSFGFWVFFTLFQFLYFLGFLWWARLRASRTKHN